MPGGNSKSDTEIRLTDVGDADAVAAHRARDADAFARWEPEDGCTRYQVTGPVSLLDLRALADAARRAPGGSPRR